MPPLKPKKPKPVSRPSSGIYFIVPNRDGTWRVRAFRADSDGEMDHVDAWRCIVVKELYSEWADTIHAPRSVLAMVMGQTLAEYYDGFPRGRVVVGDSSPCGKREATVYHGDNLVSGMGITRKQIERCFSLVRPKWVFDEHEQCTYLSARAVRTALPVQCEWKVHADPLRLPYDL